MMFPGPHHVPCALGYARALAEQGVQYRFIPISMLLKLLSYSTSGHGRSPKSTGRHREVRRAVQDGPRLEIGPSRHRDFGVTFFLRVAKIALAYRSAGDLP
jgi:hypothetical protein